MRQSAITETRAARPPSSRTMPRSLTVLLPISGLHLSALTSDLRRPCRPDERPKGDVAVCELRRDLGRERVGRACCTPARPALSAATVKRRERQLTAAAG